MSSKFSVGEMNQLADALEKAKFTSVEVTELRKPNKLSEIRGYLRGIHEIKVVKPVIDCDADPLCPNNWKIENHQKGGQFEFDPEKITLYLSDKQKSGTISGNELRKELEKITVLNVNVLDYLFANQHFIPESWKKSKSIFFWGTVYRYSDCGHLCVRYIFWTSRACWDWHYSWLDCDFSSDSNPTAALLAS